MMYRTSHGLGPGTIPQDCHIVEHEEDGWYDNFTLNRELTEEEIEKYDVRVILETAD